MILSPDQWVEAHLGPIAEALSSFVFYTVPIAGTDVPLIVMWTAVAGLFFLLPEKYLRLMDAFLPVRQEPSSLAVSPAHELSFLWERD